MRRGLCGWPGLGEGGQFASDVVGSGGADPLEDVQGLPQDDRGLGGVAGGQGAAAQANQRVRLVRWAVNDAGQVQRLPVARLGLREVTGDSVQRPALVERFGHTTLNADVAGDVQGLLQGRGRGRVLTRRPPHEPQLVEGTGLVTRNAAGQAQHIVANYRPRTALLHLSRLIGEQPAGTPYGEHFATSALE